MDMKQVTKAAFFLLAFSALGDPAAALDDDFDLKSLLSSAAVRLAAAAGTRLRRDKLNNGLCFSPDDGNPINGCHEQHPGNSIASPKDTYSFYEKLRRLIGKF